MSRQKYDVKAFQKDALLAHDKLRENHGAPPLKLNKDLTAHAQQWADHLAATNTMVHSKQQEYGENIAMKYSSAGTEFSGQEATDDWYSEVKDYSFSRPGFHSGTGHFTQVIWKDTKELGIAKAIAGNGRVFVVANYRPPGNVMGRFPENVLPPNSKMSKVKEDKKKKKGFFGKRRGSTSSSSSSSSSDDEKGNKFRLKKNGTSGDKIDTKVSKSELKQFQKEAHSVTNDYRSKHDVDSLELSGDLCKAAQDWAEHLAKKDLFEHSKSKDIGENVAMHYSSATTAYSGKQACDQWYSEASLYDYRNAGYSSGTGHFTQMIWRGSKEFGIGKAITKTGKVLVVAQFRPPGNVVGRYESNVFPRIDGYRPPSAAPSSKVTRVDRKTHFVVDDHPKTVPDRNMNTAIRQMGAIKLKGPDLSPSDLRKFQQDALDSHNKYRSRHGAANLKRSSELTKRAQDWAAHLAEKDEFKNSDQSDVGENIAMHYSSASTAFSGDETSEMWYRQVSKYNFKKPGFTSGAGHFTQMVWKDTKEMGIGKAITKEGKVILVGFYRPPGNVMGQFESQVSKEK
ncbi:uncharacterized protein [Asterias amurensis]|uniref:uncharacterized protein n=1 Tax=Asterias amurensis TaxID=7602 RepID=UPI003AB6D702